MRRLCLPSNLAVSLLILAVLTTVVSSRSPLPAAPVPAQPGQGGAATPVAPAVAGQSVASETPDAPWGSMAGTITTRGGRALRGGRVIVSDDTGRELVAVTAGDDGTFRVANLPPGTYDVRVVTARGASAGQAVVEVRAGAETRAVDIAPNGTASIAGTVTEAPSGTPIQYVTVSAYDTNGFFKAQAFTDAAGVYVISGLEPGTYFVKTRNFVGNVDEVYNDRICAGCDPHLTGDGIVVTGATTGIDFALGKGSLIAGTVRDEAQNPIGNAYVTVHANTTKQPQVASGFTGPDGAYTTTTGLPAGSYFVRVAQAGDFIGELYPDTGCPFEFGPCDYASGTLVPVSGAAAPAGPIDFVLAPGGAISGVVTGPGPVALQYASVSLYDMAGTLLAGWGTGADGSYRFRGLPAGSFYLATSYAGLLSEVYNDVPCVGFCTPAEVVGGTPVTAVVGATTPNIDFALVTAPTISGTVIEDISGQSAPTAPLASVTVHAYDPLDRWVKAAQTDAQGHYELQLAPGTYYLRTANQAGYLDELWDNVPCHRGCTVNDGSGVTIAAGQDATADFALRKGAQVSGIVSTPDPPAGPQRRGPLSGVWVSLLKDGDTIASATPTNASGAFSFTNVEPGTYKLFTSNQLGYVDEVWDDIPCAGSCWSTTGTPLVLGAGQQATADFGLLQSPKIVGTVMGAAPGSAGSVPLAGVQVIAYNGDGDWAASTTTTGSGEYALNLAAGTYFLKTTNQTNYLDEAWDNIPCANWSCVPSEDGTPLELDAGETLVADFELAPAGTITGTVTGATTSGPDRAPSAPLVNARVDVYRLAGTTALYAAQGATDAQGAYAVGGLVPGTYVVSTRVGGAYVDEVYDNLPCPPASCNRAIGTPIPVAGGATASAINFELAQAGTIAGTVIDATSQQPLAGISVGVYGQTGSYAGSAQTDDDGTYRIDGLPHGTYFVKTEFSSTYLDELWDNKPCHAGCAVTSGDPVVIGTAAALEQEVNFALAKTSRISGTVTDGGGTAISGISVGIYNSLGVQLTSATSSVAGTWTTTGKLAAGTYFARAFAGKGYLSEVWDNLPCFPTCTVTAGTPIVVGVEEDKTGITFQLDLGGSITGSVTEATPGSSPGDPVSGGSVIALTAAGGVAASGTVASGTYTVAGLGTGSYYLRYSPSGPGMYLGQLYDGLPCQGACPPFGGTLVPVVQGSQTTDRNFSLTKGGSIAGTVTDAATSTGLVNLPVGAYDAGGNLIKSVQTNSSGAYVLAGLPAGTTFVRTLASSSSQAGYVDELHAVPGFPIVDVTTGTPIPVTLGGAVTGIDFALDKGHTFGGTLTHASTGANVSASVEVFSADGFRIGSVSGFGTYTSMGLPAGTYFARSGNQQGLIDELWNTGTCLGCDPTAGTPIELPGSAALLAAVTGINFALDPGGRISGTVRTDAGLPIVTSGSINVFNEDGALVERLLASSSTGGYTTQKGLPTGTYFARADYTGFARELFENQACGISCSETAGTPIAVTSPDRAERVDFSLSSCPAITLTPLTLAGGQTGAFYSQAIQAAGGTGPYLYSTTSSVPAGLTLQGSSGLLSGLMRARGGWFSVVVSALDAAGCSGSRTYQIAVTPGEVAPEPTVSAIVPAEGSRSGGTVVTITGTGFQDGAAVAFAGVPSEDVTFVNSTSLLAVTPPMADVARPRPAADATAVDVTVTNPDTQSATLEAGFTYLAGPGITDISPESGPTAGGTVVTITGSGFESGATVRVGGVAATDVDVVDGGTIHATTGAHAAGVVDVEVQHADGQVATLAGGFTYIAPPAVSGIDPPAGPAAGGTAVAITGTDFQDGAVVTIGGESADAEVVDGTTILATTPPLGGASRPTGPRASTPVDVVVTNPDGQASTLANGFTYVPAPTVGGVSPASGPESGGTTITITGTDFQAGAVVLVGGSDASEVNVVGATTITAKTPAGTAGPADVEVRNPDDQAGILDGGFEYLAAPSVDGIDPAEGLRSGGTAITVTGDHFQSGAQLFFDGVPATNVVVVDTGTITGKTPVHAPGVVDVSVKNPDGQTGVLEEAFTYLDFPADLIVSAVSAPPAAGPGQGIVANVTTKNIGKGTAVPSSTAVYLSSDTTLAEGDTFLGSRDVPELRAGAGSSGPVAVVIPADIGPGTYYLIARADANEGIDEGHEGNNALARPLRVGVNLVVAALTVPTGASAGESIAVRDTTRNLGPGQAAASTTGFYLSPDAVWDETDVRLGGRSVPALNSGQSSAGTTSVALPADTAPGTYFVIGRADDEEVLRESNEADNTRASKTIRLGPDLAVTVVKAVASAVRGATITVTETTRNQGAGGAPASATGIYWSEDAIWDDTDILLGSRPIPALAAGGVNAGPTVVQIPSGAVAGRTYYVIAVADGAEAIAETSEANNAKAKGIRVK